MQSAVAFTVQEMTGFFGFWLPNPLPSHGGGRGGWDRWLLHQSACGSRAGGAEALGNLKMGRGLVTPGTTEVRVAGGHVT
jgi:hypothetical protein